MAQSVSRSTRTLLLLPPCAAVGEVRSAATSHRDVVVAVDRRTAGEGLPTWCTALWSTAAPKAAARFLRLEVLTGVAVVVHRMVVAADKTEAVEEAMARQRLKALPKRECTRAYHHQRTSTTLVEVEDGVGAVDVGVAHRVAMGAVEAAAMLPPASGLMDCMPDTIWPSRILGWL